MSTTIPFGPTEAQVARTLVGGTTLGDTRNELLKQILVAIANKTGGGSGTVTNFSFTDANGISGVVANPTTAPDLTLTLGAITPTSVNGLTLAAAAVGFTIAGGTTSKTLTVSNTLTLAASSDGFTLTVPATGTAALLGTANAFTAAQTISVNGAASTPPLALTGTIFTGGTSTTTKPALLIEPTGTTSTGWSTSGTLLGVNAPSGFTGYLFDYQINGTSKVRFEISTGRLYIAVPTTDSGAIFGNNFAILGARGTSLRSDLQYLWAPSTNPLGTADTGFARASAGAIKVTNGSSGYGSIDASAFNVSGVAGATGGTFTAITSITVANGIITAISGT